MYRNNDDKQTNTHKYDTYSLLEGHGGYFIVSVEPKGTILRHKMCSFSKYTHHMHQTNNSTSYNSPILPNTHTKHSYINSPSNQIVLQCGNSLKRFDKFTQLTTLPQQNEWDT